LKQYWLDWLQKSHVAVRFLIMTSTTIESFINGFVRTCIPP
jgi:hypothetical protein